MNAEIDTSQFSRKLEQLKVLSGKSWKAVVQEQAKLLAKRLAQLTPPYKQTSGKKGVAVDIGRVYLRSDWFNEKFNFRNQKLDKRVKDAVLEQDEATLLPIFQNSTRLNRIHIEAFDPEKHRAARRDGRVNYPAPFSFPLAQQSQIADYTKLVQKAVGTAKAGWAYCFKLLGGSIPGWQDKPVGNVEDKSTLEENPYIIVTNKVSYFSNLNSKMNIVARSLVGRAETMIIAAEKAMKEAAKAAGW